FYSQQLWVCVNLVTVPLVALGLWFYLVREEGRRYRLIGWTALVTFVLFAVAGSRSYYTVPLYPVLLAGGAALLAIWVNRLRPVIARAIYGLQWTAMVASGVLFVLIVVPVAPIGSRVWDLTSKIHEQFREEVGWPDLAEHVAQVYNTLPAEERARTGIL